MPVIRYMIESVRKGDPSNPVYEPAGVWAVDQVGHLAIRFAPGYRRAEAAALEVLDRIRAAGNQVPPNFLQHHIDQLSPYLGVRGPIRTTDAYRTVDTCAQSIVRDILAGTLAATTVT